MLPFFRKATVGLAIAYPVALLILILLWWTVGETQWWLILLRYAPGVIYLFPSLGLAVLGGLLRLRPHPVLVLVHLSLLTFLLGFQLPEMGTAPAADLKVMTYNVRAGLGGAEKIGQYLLATEADVVGLQEARTPIAADLPDPVPAIEKAMDGYEIARGGIRGELVILSRFPILRSRERDLAGLSQALEAELEVGPGQRLRVFNVHLMTGDPKKLLSPGASVTARLEMTASTRHQQTTALLELLSESDVPTVLLGDFNTPPNSQDYARLSQVLGDSFAQRGFGFGYTYSTGRPVWRIDYIWHSAGLAATQCEVEKVSLSDHRSLWAGLAYGSNAPIDSP